MEALMGIHELGIQHNDFTARNIVVDNLKSPQRLVIIDFETATDHNCQRGCEIGMYQYPPGRGEFNCEELYNTAKLTNIWTPGERYSFNERNAVVTRVDPSALQTLYILMEPEFLLTES